MQIKPDTQDVQSRQIKEGFMPRKLKRNKKLSMQQRLAVEERAKPECLNNVSAVEIAYPKSLNWTPNTKARFACDLFKKPHVAYALDKERDKIRKLARKSTSLTAQRVIDEFQCIALANLPDIVQYSTKVGPGGVKIYVMTITDFDQLTDSTKKAIKKIKIKSFPKKDEDGKTMHVIQEVEFEMYNKQAALDSLAKYYNLFIEKVEVNHTGNVGVIHTTVQELRVLFDSMSPEERAKHLNKLAEDMKSE